MNSWSLTDQLYKSIKMKSSINIPLEYTIWVCNWAHSACNTSGLIYYNKLSIAFKWLYFCAPLPNTAVTFTVPWCSDRLKSTTSRTIHCVDSVHTVSGSILLECSFHKLSYYIRIRIPCKNLYLLNRIDPLTDWIHSLNITATNEHTYTHKIEWLDSPTGQSQVRGRMRERERKTQVEQVPEDVTDQASLGTRNRREKTSSCEVQ